MGSKKSEKDSAKRTNRTSKKNSLKKEKNDAEVVYELSEEHLKSIDEESKKRLRNIYHNVEYRRKINLQTGVVTLHNVTDDFTEKFASFSHFLSSYIQHFNRKIDYTSDFESKANLCNEMIDELQGFKIEALDFEKEKFELIKKLNTVIEVYNHYKQRFLDSKELKLSTLQKRSSLSMKQKILVLEALGVLKFIGNQTNNNKNQGNLIADLFEIEPQNLIRAIRMVDSEKEHRDVSRTEENLEAAEQFLKKYKFEDAVKRLNKNQ